MKEQIQTADNMPPSDETIEGKLEAVKRTPKTERAQKLVEFKDTLAEYKIHWGEVTKELIAAIQENPDIPRQEFMATFYRLAEVRGMHADQEKDLADGGININREARIVEHIFEQYQKKHATIKRLREEYADDASLFKYLFRDFPKGKIEIIEGLSHLHVRCWDEADYQTVWRGDSEDAAASSGVKVAHIYDVTAEKNTKEQEFSEQRSQAIYAHEAQHVMWELLHDIRSSFEKEIDEDGAVEDSYDQERVTNMMQIEDALMNNDRATLFSSLKSYHRRNRRDIADVHAANEILAFVAGGTDSADIVTYLLQSKKQGGLYDYSYREKQKNWHSLVPLPWTERWTGRITDMRTKRLFTTCFNTARDEVYRTEYEQLVRNGVTALTTLAEKVGKPEAIAILTQEPLSKWEKTVDRIINTHKQSL